MPIKFTYYIFYPNNPAFRVESPIRKQLCVRNTCDISLVFYLVLGVDVASEVEHPVYELYPVLHGRVHQRGVSRDLMM